MGNAPYDFIRNYSSTKSKKDRLQNFVHRTFNTIDLDYFILSLKNIYLNHGGLEAIFSKYQTKDSLQPAIHYFKNVFFELNHEKRTEKHISDPLKNSAAKRINMFLRWMVRPNNTGVDFGLWKSIPTSKLSCPLDVHTGNIGRKLGLLYRKTNDAKALKELDTSLRIFDKNDPVKYDFALFGLGVFENFH
jgi:uncharacterized protein (TIGR02757 family)